MALRTRVLGPTDLEVSGLSLALPAYPAKPPGAPERRALTAALVAAADEGVRLFLLPDGPQLGPAARAFRDALGQEPQCLAGLRVRRPWHAGALRPWDPKVLGGLRASIRRAVEALGRAGSPRPPRIDLLYLEPMTAQDLEDQSLLDALAQLVQDGQVRAIAWSAIGTHDARAIAAAPGPVGAVGCLFNAIEQGWALETFDSLPDPGPAWIATGVLHGGLLAGRHVEDPAREFAPEDPRSRWERGACEFWRSLCRATGEFFARRGPFTLAQVAIAFALSRPQIATALVTARTAEQVRELCAGARRSLSSEELRWLNAF